MRPATNISIHAPGIAWDVSCVGISQLEPRRSSAWALVQAGGIDDDGEEDEISEDEALKGGDAAAGSETATGIAAVEGLLSGLALDAPAAERPAARNSARQAAAGGELQEPSGAALAADDSTLQPAKAAGTPQAPALAEDTQPAQADAAEEDDGRISAEGIANSTLSFASS